MPLVEETEACEVEILDGANVKRKLTTPTTSAVYSSAEQTADWGGLLAPGDTLTIRIFQLSALTAVLTRKIGPHERSIVLLITPMLANVVLMGLALPFLFQPMPPADIIALAAIALLSLPAMQCIIFAFRAAEAVIVAPMQYSQILWAVFYGALLFGEWPDGATVLGAAVIIASGLFILFREAGAGRKAPRHG